MARTEHYYTRFIPGSFYHVYNRSVNKKNMFLNTGNYKFFLRRYAKYLSPVVATYSYALCGNHFHFGIRVKSEEELMRFVRSTKKEGRYKTAHALVSRQFQNLFLSYAKAFNKQNNRIGTLFQKPFKRFQINSEAKLLRMILYHHANPLNHGLCADIHEYSWTSYQRYLNSTSSALPKEKVFALFGGKDQYIETHQTMNRSIINGNNWFQEMGF